MPWASYQIRKIAGLHAPGMPWTFFPPSQVSDSDMHHDTCVTHVPWCMPGSLTTFPLKSVSGKNVQGIPVACTNRNFTHLVRGPWTEFESNTHCACRYHGSVTSRFYIRGRQLKGPSVKTMSSIRQNDVATSFWCNNDVIIKSRVR